MKFQESRSYDDDLYGDEEEEEYEYDSEEEKTQDGYISNRA
eukprot:CAMPEP_0170562468 /NCGR_PEP_ID=MMETSP0211-20121228/60696_1 /TAXON_ID=311385 /ORGANISM="Pseudokeronopsis sp., Strain OXSARD2" /LENGTH=40 /DNA_ID= /DNA_START= /DNA_END= /DNA_ORIENTATION=